MDLDRAAAPLAGTLAVVAAVTASAGDTVAGDGHVLQLDAMRGLAALVVLAGHLAQVFWQPFVDAQDGWVHLFATTSRHAVLVFFLLSGYLISDGIRRNVRRQGLFSAGPYALARAARLWPPLLGAVLWTAVAAALWPHLAPAGVGPALQAQPWEYLGALLFARGLEQANPVLWSLNIEARLYLIAGLAAWAWSRRRWAHPVGLAALALLVLCVLEQALFLVCAAVWLIGAAVALLPARWQAARRRLCGAALLGCLALLLLQPQRLSVLEPQPGWQLALQLLAALGYVTLLFDLRWPTWALRAPGLAAGFSYTLYLVHWPLLLLVMAAWSPSVHSQMPTAVLATLTGAVLALGLAMLLGGWLERPAQVRHWVESRLVRWRSGRL